jgi:hypothetical protein
MEGLLQLLAGSSAPRSEFRADSTRDLAIAEISARVAADRHTSNSIPAPYLPMKPP